MTASGQLRIVPSCALESLVPGEAEPVLYTWRWYHTASGMGLWLVLIAALILPKANRTPKTWLILVPLGIVSGGWLLVRTQMGGNLPDNVVFGMMVHTLAVGSAVLWLLAHRLPPGMWYKTLLAATGIALGVTIVGGFSLGVESHEMIAATVFMGVMMVATVTGYVLAAWGCRARRAWWFFVFQAAGNLAVSLVGMFLGLLVLVAVLDGGPKSVAQFLAAALGVGLGAGLVTFLIALPFAILGLSSPFFRQRLRTCRPQPTGADSR